MTVKNDESADSLSAVSGQTKQRWEPPTIEEIDYASTEAFIVYGGVDAGIYAS